MVDKPPIVARLYAEMLTQEGAQQFFTGRLADLINNLPGLSVVGVEITCNSPFEDCPYVFLIQPDSLALDLANRPAFLIGEDRGRRWVVFDADPPFRELFSDRTRVELFRQEKFLAYVDEIRRGGQ